jgi:hypothetical protein
MSQLKYLSPEEKKMYLMVAFGAGSFLCGLVADAISALAWVLYPAAVVCAVLFVLTVVGPAEKLFPLRSLPQRTGFLVRGWTAQILKAVFFFGGISLALYLVLELLRRL